MYSVQIGRSIKSAISVPRSHIKQQVCMYIAHVRSMINVPTAQLSFLYQFDWVTTDQPSHFNAILHQTNLSICLIYQCIYMHWYNMYIYICIDIICIFWSSMSTETVCWLHVSAWAAAGRFQLTVLSFANSLNIIRSQRHLTSHRPAQSRYIGGSLYNYSITYTDKYGKITCKTKNAISV